MESSNPNRIFLAQITADRISLIYGVDISRLSHALDCNTREDYSTSFRFTLYGREYKVTVEDMPPLVGALLIEPEPLASRRAPREP